MPKISIWKTSNEGLGKDDVYIFTNIRIVHVAFHESKSWGEKAEQKDIDTFGVTTQLWCWRRLLKIPWITTKIN